MHLSSASDGRPRKLLDRLAPVTRGPCGGCWLVGRFIFKVILLSRLRERERGSVRPFALYTSSDVSTPLRPSKQHCLDVSYVHFTSFTLLRMHRTYSRVRPRTARSIRPRTLKVNTARHSPKLDSARHQTWIHAGPGWSSEPSKGEDVAAQRSSRHF